MVFDKGRSARAAALAVGGRWHPLQPGGAFTLLPGRLMNKLAFGSATAASR